MKHLLMLLACLIVFAPFAVKAFDGKDFTVQGQTENNGEGHPLVSGDLLNYGNRMPEGSGDGIGKDGPRRATTTTYSMKVAVSMPTGTTGASLATTQPTNTKLSSCANTAVDAVTITLTYNAGATNTLKEVYVFFFNTNYNPNFGAANRFYAIKKGSLATPVTFAAYNVLTSANSATNDIYLKASNNPGGSITDILLGSSLGLEGAPVGTWQVVGIVAANSTIDFDNPSTWSAWDVGTFIIKKPWSNGAANDTCV